MRSFSVCMTMCACVCFSLPVRNAMEIIIINRINNMSQSKIDWEKHLLTTIRRCLKCHSNNNGGKMYEKWMNEPTKKHHVRYWKKRQVNIARCTNYDLEWPRINGCDNREHWTQRRCRPPWSLKCNSNNKPMHHHVILFNLRAERARVRLGMNIQSSLNLKLSTSNGMHERVFFSFSQIFLIRFFFVVSFFTYDLMVVLLLFISDHIITIEVRINIG